MGWAAARHQQEALYQDRLTERVFLLCGLSQKESPEKRAVCVVLTTELWICCSHYSCVDSVISITHNFRRATTKLNAAFGTVYVPCMKQCRWFTEHVPCNVLPAAAATNHVADSRKVCTQNSKFD